MKPGAIIRIACRTTRLIMLAPLSTLLMTATARCVEHPGVVAREVECSSCHAKQLTGKSVHSAMVSPCTVCHVTQMRGDMLTVSLLMPKEKICSACHDESAALGRHTQRVKGACVDCHDSHSSERNMLLRNLAAVIPPRKK